MADTLSIREASPEDLAAVLDVERRAFGEQDEADLVALLLEDPSARPALSLIACTGETPVGHILFTHAVLRDGDRTETVALLAPLAVVPEAQNRGVGRALIEAGVERLDASQSAQLVIVLGHPGYYPRAGFEPAIPHRIVPPYGIHPPEAFMVREIRKGALETIRGTLEVADSIRAEEYWRE